MARSYRTFRARIAFLCLLLPALALAAGTPEQLLLGKWRHVSLRQVIDGRELPPRSTEGQAYAEFQPGGKWELTGPTSRSGGTYKWLAAGRIETTTVHSNHPVQLGAVSVKKVSVTGDRLELVTVQTRAELDKAMGPPKAGVRRPDITVVTSVFEREPGN